jgi:transposase-like protein
VSRSFVARTKEALIELMSRPLADVRLAVLMIDGVGLKDHTCVVALGITTDGVKIPLGLWDGSTENKTVTAELLSNLVARGLDVEQGVLVVIDGSKALRAAVNDVLGRRTPVQRCIRHKERNVLDHLPERDRELVKRRLRRAWKEPDHATALEQLTTLAVELERSHPGAAASLREGIAETLTVTRLRVNGKLRKTLESTNPCESMIECVRRSSRNVKHWQNGEMCLRWTAAGMLEAEQQFRRRDRPQRPRETRRRRRARSHPSPAQPRSDRGDRYRRRRVNITPGPPPKFHTVRDILLVWLCLGSCAARLLG